MLRADQYKWKRIGDRLIRILLSIAMLLQMLVIPDSALALDAFAFRGYNSENVTNSTFTYGYSDASINGTTVSFTSAGTGQAIGQIVLNEEGDNDISTSVDLGGLEIDFSTVATTTQEDPLEEGGVGEVDTALAEVKFFGSSGNQTGGVSLSKSAEAGSETLHSGASIPSGTREIYIYLYGTSVSSTNTVVFSDTSLVIHDSSAPSCEVVYDPDWTNQPVAISINAADSDSGLEGIYLNGEWVTRTPPYEMTIDTNGTSFSVYSKDYAGKTSEVQTITINNIDTAAPAAPESLSVSTGDWTNADVSVLVPDLPASSGSPERYVYKIGTGSWSDLPKGYAISDNGISTISVAVEDAAGNRSGFLQATAKIDKLAPVIDTFSSTVSSGSCRVDLTAHDTGASGLRDIRFAEGTQSADYFASNGTIVTDGTFTVNKGGDYTVCVSDNAGNRTLQTKMLSTAPTLLEIDDKIIDEDEPLCLTLSIYDAESARSELSVDVTTDDPTLLPSITLDQNDLLTITPGANLYGGPANVTVTVTDPQGEHVSDSFTVTVNSVNDPPEAKDDGPFTLDEDTPLSIDVLANDSDVEGAELTIQSCGAATNGTTLIVLGKVRYTPNANYVGSDSFTYTVTDGNGGSSTATVTLNVTNVNDAPVAQNDEATCDEDSTVLIPVLVNDSDIDTDVNSEETVTVSDLGTASHGTIKKEGGAIRYTPSENYFGSDTFTYTISDKAGLTSTATVTVSVSPQPDAPIFIDLEDSYTIDEDSSANANEITFSIHDVETPADSMMLQVASATASKIEQNGIHILGLGDTSDEVVLSISPAKDQSGDATLILLLGDGFTTVQRTITIHIKDVNDAPQVEEDTVNFNEDTPFVDISIATLLANDTDIEGDPLSFGEIKTQPSSGSVSKLDEETLRYIPETNFDGETSFTYSVSDGQVTSIATCKLIATGSNDAPTILFDDDTAVTTEDTLSGEISFRISDQETAAKDLLLIAKSGNAELVAPDQIAITNKGDGTGTIRIYPQADANGDVTITLTVSDGVAQSYDTIVLTINPAEDAPVAEDDEVYSLYSGSLTFGVLENDHDVDGDSLSVYSHTATGLPGTLTFDESTQLFTYTPVIGENGDQTFTYTVWDGSEQDTATVTLHVSNETHNPVISPVNSQYVQEDGTISNIAVSVTDEDVGDEFTLEVASSDSSKLPVDESHVTIANNGNGSFTLQFTPVSDCSGSVAVTLTVKDKAQNTDTTSFTLYIIAQNDPPVAHNDAAELDEDTSVQLDLLTNDTDADGDTLRVTSVATPAHGSLSLVNGKITYTPYSNWNGSETLSYSITDGRAGASASVTIVVNRVNDSPVAWNDYVELPNEAQATAASINVIHNDKDLDGDTVHANKITIQPRYGTATINPDGTIKYIRSAASPDANGADSFQYQIIDRSNESDEEARTAVATVYIGVDFVSSLYTYGRSVTCYEDCKPFDFTLDVTNPSNVNYTLTINTVCTLGTLEVVGDTANTIHFTPYENAYGSQNITYTVASTENSERHTGTIWLIVYPVNDLPMIDSAPTEITVQEDASTHASFDVVFHDADCATSGLYFNVYTRSASTEAPVAFSTGFTVQRTGTGSTVTINPDTNVNGSAVIVVGVSDGFAYTEQTISLTITPEDDAPVLSGVSRTIHEDMSVSFAALTSDYEVDGDQTTVSIDTPQHGTAVLRSDKTIQYKPDANYYGTDTFQITVTDKTEAKRSASATVTINIISVNDPPSISGVEYYQTTLEDTVKTIPITVTDVDDDMTASSSYKFVSGDESIVRSEDITISHDSETGKMILSVKPVENAYGSVVIRVTATDSAGVSAKASFLLRITPVNDVPVANNDSATVSEVISTGNESVAPMTITTMNLIENDTDVEGGALSIVAITDVQNGIVTSNGNGTVTISADGDSTKDVTFHYMIMDPGGATASADATLVITPSNDPPRTQEDSYTIDEDEQSTFEVLVNDVDPEEEALSISDVSIPSHGTATISGTSIVFIPAKDYNGTDSFTYTATDASGASAEPTTVRISIRSINDAPEISKHESNSGDWQMTEDTPKSFHFVVSDAESAVKNLIVRIKSLDETLVKTSQIQLSTNEGGYNTILVTPNKDQYGTVPVEFIVSDGLLSTTVTYNILITGANDPPVVTPMDLETDEDTKITKTAVASDVENNPVTFFLSDTPQYGTAAVNADGSFTYTPEKDFNGSDSFVIGANDGQSENSTGTALIRIQVLPANDPPTAVDDTTSTNEDTAVDIDVIANDTDMDLDYGDALTILRIPTAPTKGTAQIVDNKIHYVPSKDLNGTDTFTYEICDQDGKPSTATVTVQITAVNDVPAGGNDTAEVFEDNSVTIDVLANDDVDMTTNPGHEALTITKIATNPSHGTARISDGAIIYTPTENYFSPEDTPDTFTYIVTDSGNLTAEFTVSVNVKAVNDAPTLTVAGGSEQFANVNMDEDTVSSAIAFTVSDVEDAAGSLSVSVTHDNSDLLPTITVTPNAAGECSFVIDSKDNKVGTATITVKVTDSGQLSAVKTFTVDVKQVNDAPIAQDDVKTIPEGGSDSIDVLYNDDVDKLDGNGGDTLTLLSIGTAEFGSPTYGTASIVDNKILYTQTVTTTNKLSYTDVFGYTMKDASGQTSSAKVTVTIRPFNDYPVISSVSNVADLPEDTENGTGDLSFRVSDEEDNDDGLAVTASSSNTKLVPNANIVISNPDAEADSTGQQRTVRIISAKDQFGTAAITLTVRDAEGQKTSTTFTVTVLPVNDAPADGDDVVEVDEDHSIQISVLTNDDVDLVTNPATEHLEVTGIVTNPSHGTVTIPDGNQSIIYKPNDNYFSLSGSPDVFTYAMKDSSGLTAEFTVSVNVKAVNDAPTIDYDGEPKYTVPEGTSVVDIPFYVDDVDNNTNPSLGDLGVTVTAKSSNSVLVKPEGLTIRNGAGKLRYLTVQPYMNWNGTTTIYITAADLDGAKATKSFLLEVTNVNAKPVAVADSITVPEDAVSNLNVLANDTDDDLITNPFTENLYVNFVSTESANATVSIAAGGKSVVFNPIANFNGEVVITYTTKDEAGAVSNSVNSTITVSQVNDAPEPADDAVTVDEDKTIEIAVLSNDWDIDKDEDLNAIPGAEILSASISEDDLLKPSHGKITIENNVITYDSNDNYNGPDTFEY
ncbi:MAG: Ig-like domain-containing protein, partial [Eubacteriales bacterium]|nr:Ig-like domain-containing protein [Eubacteriales bacterium]